MMASSDLVLGYDFDKWHGYGYKDVISIDASRNKNSHCLCVGKSGSGKSYYTLLLCARISNLVCDDSSLPLVYFADFKRDSTYSFMSDCPRYFSYYDTMDALRTVYEIMHQRQSGDSSLRPITLFIDEYTAFISALEIKDKKQAEMAKKMIAETLMLGRSLSVRLVLTSQTAYAENFPKGARLNIGVIVILGDYQTDINYEMLLPKKYIDQIGERQFGLGEGVVMLNDSKMRYIKVPRISNEEKMKQACIDALTRE